MFELLTLIAMTAVADAPAEVSAPPSLAAPAAPPKNPLDRVVCKTEDTLGSRLGSHRVCATVREWREQQDDNREATEHMQQNQPAPTGT